MFTNNNLVKNTTHKVVLPFYLYAALSLLVTTILLLFSTAAFTQHYFHPHLLAITHAMALGWGTMMILGASHQLVPVLIEGRLYSIWLGYISFILAAVGIPLLVYGFYFFNMGWQSQWGAVLVNVAILAYLINLSVSMAKSTSENVHAVYVFTASLWLMLTMVVGLLQVFNFTVPILPKDSLHYLPLHAHMGIIGWFLLLVIGVGSRLIPMFLISKYSNPKLLWIIYGLINGGLLLFLILFLYFPSGAYFFLPVTGILVAVVFFGFYCYGCFKKRIRKQVDPQMKISLISVSMMLLPIGLLFIIIGWLLAGTVDVKLIMIYGFVVFFGWITAIILGMTFKTLPFIVWHKVYHLQAGLGKTPNPKDLFSRQVFTAMAVFYLLGFILFTIGILATSNFILKSGAVLLLSAAILYNWNVIKILKHQPANL